MTSANIIIILSGFKKSTCW